LRIIHVLRKPLGEGNVAANVLKYGCGAVNVDAGRIGVAETDRRHTERPASTGKLYDSDANRAIYGHGLAGAAPMFHVEGRWPANLILEHLPGCQQTGTQEVKGNRTDGRPEGDAGREDRTQWRFRPTEATRRGYSDKHGKETIESWACEPGC
jgi:site-specific DNA-methyltransferase (adenine-specific)